jgi:hypothetical protein
MRPPRAPHSTPRHGPCRACRQPPDSGVRTTDRTGGPRGRTRPSAPPGVGSPPGPHPGRWRAPRRRAGRPPRCPGGASSAVGPPWTATEGGRSAARSETTNRLHRPAVRSSPSLARPPGPASREPPGRTPPTAGIRSVEHRRGQRESRSCPHIGRLPARAVPVPRSLHREVGGPRPRSAASRKWHSRRWRDQLVSLRVRSCRTTGRTAEAGRAWDRVLESIDELLERCQARHLEQVRHAGASAQLP